MPCQVLTLVFVSQSAPNLQHVQVVIASFLFHQLPLRCDAYFLRFTHTPRFLLLSNLCLRTRTLTHRVHTITNLTEYFRTKENRYRSYVTFTTVRIIPDSQMNFDVDDDNELEGLRRDVCVSGQHLSIETRWSNFPDLLQVIIDNAKDFSLDYFLNERTIAICPGQCYQVVAVICHSGNHFNGLYVLETANPAEPFLLFHDGMPSPRTKRYEQPWTEKLPHGNVPQLVWLKRVVRTHDY